MNQKQERTGRDGPKPSLPPNVPAELGERLRRLESLAGLGVLSAGVAHEIKNALVPVKTFVDLLIEENPGSELAGIVERELERINLLVAQMLKLARPAPTRMAPLSVHQVLNDSLRLVQHQAESKSIAIVTEFAPGPGSVLGDRNQLEQVFLNFFFNAIEAMDENGRLSLKTQNVSDGSAQPRLNVIIADTGIGMDAEEVRHLFEPFFSTKPEGTGLGMTIANEIISGHGGSISVQSRSGEGTQFTISLPSPTQTQG